MLIDFGFGALIVALVISLIGIGASIAGVQMKKNEWVESARFTLFLSFPLISIAALALIYLLSAGIFEVEYVASVTSRSMPIYLRVTSLWGGQSGSLVLWSWLMSLFAFGVASRSWKRDKELLPWVIIVIQATTAFFLILNIFFENPFSRIWRMPDGTYSVAMFQPEGGLLAVIRDGQGLNPLLRHPGMIIHPPMLYLGFVGFVIPFAFAAAALITGQTTDRWLRISRRWTLVAWLFLSLGLILGARWAYDVLGWGGYWGWDPVEISALMPWLTGTAFLHSAVMQEKRGILKQWNMVLIILTYCLVLFGTFLTRSNVLSSVHAFAESKLGPMFFGFIGITFILSLALILHRWDDLKSENRVTSLLSREALFLYNNLLFIGVLIVCFWGVIFPLISELVSGQKVTVGPPFYERASGPIFAGLLLLMGIVPLSTWRFSTSKTIGRTILKPAALAVLIGLIWPLLSGVYAWPALLSFFLIALVFFVTLAEFWHGVSARTKNQGEDHFSALFTLIARNRRRYGGYIIHLGVALMTLGIIGIEIFQRETQQTIQQGEIISIGDYSLKFTSMAVFDTSDGRNIARAVVEVSKDGQLIGELYPRRDFYIESQQPVTIPGIRSTLSDDLYIILIDWLPLSTQSASFKVFINPLINWLWIGTIVFILGTLIAAWPEQTRVVESDLLPKTSYAQPAD